MIDNRVTILVNSCDKYEDAWDPYFKLLSIQWPELPYRIVLNTEHKDYFCDYISVDTVKTGDAETWTERIKFALKQINSEYILFSLEDFFLLSPVNVKSFDKIIDVVEQKQDIGFVWFAPKQQKLNNLKKKMITSNLYVTKRSYSFRVSASMGLWRKEFLLQMLFRDGNPWYFEWSAPKLSRYSDFKATFWEQNVERIFDYEIRPESGLGIVRSKWLPGNKALFEKYGINVNFEKLGFTTYDEALNSIGLEKKENNKFKKMTLTVRKKLKGCFNDLKRFPKLYPAFKKYCKYIDPNKKDNNGFNR